MPPPFVVTETDIDLQHINNRWHSYTCMQQCLSSRKVCRRIVVQNA